MTSRPSTAAPILVVLAIALVMLGAYVGGYFWLGERDDWQAVASPAPGYLPTWGVADLIERTYPRPWLAMLYEPAGFVEGKFRGVPVQISSRPPPAVTIDDWLKPTP